MAYSDRHPGSIADPEPGSWIRVKFFPDPGSRIPTHISESLEVTFRVKHALILIQLA
jgi:hypothetical protein